MYDLILGGQKWSLTPVPTSFLSMFFGFPQHNVGEGEMFTKRDRVEREWVTAVAHDTLNGFAARRETFPLLQASHKGVVTCVGEMGTDKTVCV